MNSVNERIFASSTSFIHLMYGFIVKTDEPNIIKNKLLETFGKKYVNNMFFVSAGAIAIFSSNSLHGFSNGIKLVGTDGNVSFDAIRQIGGFNFNSANMMPNYEQFIIDNAVKMFAHKYTCTNVCWYVAVYENLKQESASDDSSDDDSRNDPDITDESVVLRTMMKVTHVSPKIDIQSILKR